MNELKEDKLYYEGAGQEAMDKWRALTEDERKAQKLKGDAIDQIDTSDLEFCDANSTFFNEISFDFFEKNRINLARAFLGMDGGYSIRKLKKFMMQDKIQQQEAKDEQKKKFETRRTAAVEGGAEGDADGVKSIDTLEYSDESDIEEALKVIDEDTFNKIIDEANAQIFANEEEAKTFFEGKIKDWSRMKLKKRKVVKDERESKDPYYAMMKEEKEIGSRFANHFDLDDLDMHSYYDSIE